MAAAVSVGVWEHPVPTSEQILNRDAFLNVGIFFKSA